MLDSRRARKRYDKITARLGGDARPMRRLGPLYWAPRKLSWLIGALFMVGSFCFAAGTIVAITKQGDAAGIIFFTGSIFFTSAAYAQYLEVVNSGGERGKGGGLRAISLEPKRIEWWACSIQLIGTLFFNVTTFTAMLDILSTTRQDRVVWAPDAIGSICFLIASYLAYYEVCGRWLCWRKRGIAWWIAAANLIGSIAFGISALGAYVIHDTGELVNAAADNAGTFIGAVMFFVGAYMLWPEADRDSTV